MKDKLYKKIRHVVRKTCDEKNIGIAFSGGLDSTLLAMVYKDLEKNITLLTVGFSESEDTKYAKKVSEKLGLPILFKEPQIDEVEKYIKKIISTVNFYSPVELEIYLAYFYIFKLASENNIRTISLTNGIDELFCGYNKYRKILETGGEEGVQEAIKSEVNRALEYASKQQKIANLFKIKLINPFLEKEFIEFSLKIPVNLKIKSPQDDLRKHILRDVAKEIKVPSDSVIKRKRAIQYSSGISNLIEKLAKKKFDKSKAKQMGYRGVKEAYINSLIKEVT